MKIVITGGAGFVGSQVGYYFHNLGHDVFLIDNMSYGKKDNLIIDGSSFGTFIKADIRDEDTDKVYQSADLVLHFAGIAPLPDCQTNPENAYDNNVSGTIRVLEACRKASVPKIVFASTSAIYENCKKFPLKEDKVDIEPNLIYSMSKRSCELICKSYVENYGMDITTLRFFNVYGPHQDFKRKHPPLMGYITKSLLENSVPTFFSTGDQKRDYVYTEDISRMISSIIETPDSKGETFNVCSEKAYSVKEIYEIYRSFFENSKDPQFKKSEEFWDKYPELFRGDYSLKKDRVVKEVNKYSLGSFSKAKRILGWEPSVTMKEGIRRCVEYALNTESEEEINNSEI
tara:strand:- start:2292 stop:3323 length:1032 start_codon:yes stop_codon:yes gene_type:complete